MLRNHPNKQISVLLQTRVPECLHRMLFIYAGSISIQKCLVLLFFIVVCLTQQNERHLVIFKKSSPGNVKKKVIIQVQSFITKCLSFRRVSFFQGYRLYKEPLHLNKPFQKNSVHIDSDNHTFKYSYRKPPSCNKQHPVSSLQQSLGSPRLR